MFIDVFLFFPQVVHSLHTFFVCLFKCFLFLSFFLSLFLSFNAFFILLPFFKILSPSHAIYLFIHPFLSFTFSFLLLSFLLPSCLSVFAVCLTFNFSHTSLTSLFILQPEDHSEGVYF